MYEYYHSCLQIDGCTAKGSTTHANSAVTPVYVSPAPSSTVANSAVSQSQPKPIANKPARVALFTSQCKENLSPAKANASIGQFAVPAAPVTNNPNVLRPVYPVRANSRRITSIVSRVAASVSPVIIPLSASSDYWQQVANQWEQARIFAFSFLMRSASTTEHSEKEKNGDTNEEPDATQHATAESDVIGLIIAFESAPHPYVIELGNNVSHSRWVDVAERMNSSQEKISCAMQLQMLVLMSRNMKLNGVLHDPFVCEWLLNPDVTPITSSRICSVVDSVTESVNITTLSAKVG